jgi:mono/diheme cytochrome c family protein
MPPLRPTAALLATLLCMPLATQAQGQPQPLSQAQSRGELLYSTYCAECHSSQMHWREKKTVRDWPSLRAQVAFWQAQAQLGWGEEDITAVARYLNARYYRLPPDAKTAAALPGGPATATLLASRYRPPAP